jgi:hypothetical protein|tara:strand:+ start:2958 stop:3740 length:783 start_codon:yes stop_codon:yes gene_type:complete
MKPLPVKKIISKSFSIFVKDFNNFINIVIVPFVIILPFYLYTIYYDDLILNLFEKEGFVSYLRGSPRTKIINFLLIFPITSCFMASWHRYVFFNGKKPWTYIPLDLSGYSIKFIWKAILVGLIFIVPTYAFFFLIGYFGLFTNVPIIILAVVIYIIVGIIYFVRISIIFPATAMEKENTIKKIFQLTKNNFWRMFLIYISAILFFLLFAIILFIYEIYLPTEGNLMRTMMIGIVEVIYVFFMYAYLASCASQIYKHLIDD